MKFEERLEELFLAVEEDEDVFASIKEFVEEVESTLKEHSIYCDDAVRNGMIAAFLQMNEIEDFTFIENDVPSLFVLYAHQLLIKDRLDEAIQYAEKSVEIGLFAFDHLLFLLDLYLMKEEHDLIVYTFRRLYEAASDALQLATYFVLFGRYMMDNEDYHFALCMFEYSQRISFLDASEEFIATLLKQGKKRPTQKEVEQFLKKDIVESNGSYYAIAGRYIAAEWAKGEGEYQAAYEILSEIEDILGSDPMHVKEYKETLEELQKEALSAGVEVVMHREMNAQRMVSNIPQTVYLCTTMVKGSIAYSSVHKEDRVFLKMNGSEIGVYTFKQQVIGCIPKKHEEILMNLLKAGFTLYGIVDAIDERIHIRVYLSVPTEEEKEQVLMA